MPGQKSLLDRMGERSGKRRATSASNRSAATKTSLVRPRKRDVNDEIDLDAQEEFHMQKEFSDATVADLANLDAEGYVLRQRVRDLCENGNRFTVPRVNELKETFYYGSRQVSAAGSHTEWQAPNPV